MSKLTRILLVEDNPGDIFLLKEALKDSRLKTHLQIARDGEVALSMLSHEGVYSSLEDPDLVLLDLDAPLKDGPEVLQKMQQDKRFSDLPVIVLINSRNQESRLREQKLQASKYIIKPADLDGYFLLVESIEELCRSLNTAH